MKTALILIARGMWWAVSMAIILPVAAFTLYLLGIMVLKAVIMYAVTAIFLLPIWLPMVLWNYISRWNKVQTLIKLLGKEFNKQDTVLKVVCMLFMFCVAYILPWIIWIPLLKMMG